jgi:hypothetical protein
MQTVHAAERQALHCYPMHRTHVVCYHVRDRLCRLVALAADRTCIVLPVRYELNLYMLCRRK